MQFEYKSKLFNIEGIENDLIYDNISRLGTFYEINLLEYIYRIKSFFQSKDKKNIVLDVGANIGNHSIFFGSFIANHLIAIEPNPEVLPILRNNLSKNIESYTLFESAVGEKEGLGTIFFPEYSANNYGEAKIDSESETGSIKISTVDSIISSWKQKEKNSFTVSLIKIDVEGMELQVLKGAKKTILEYKPHIFAEAETKEEFKKVYSYLKSLGYKKLPGHWAATPVHQYVYNPSLSLYITCFYMQWKKIIHRINNSLKKRLPVVTVK